MSCRKELRAGSLAGTGGTACRPSTETGPEVRPKATVAAGRGVVNCTSDLGTPPPRTQASSCGSGSDAAGVRVWQVMSRGGHEARGKRRPRQARGIQSLVSSRARAMRYVEHGRIQLEMKGLGSKGAPLWQSQSAFLL